MQTSQKKQPTTKQPNNNNNKNPECYFETLDTETELQLLYIVMSNI